MFETIALGLASLFTAVISGAIGMAGGITLFAIMTFIVPWQVLVPLHGMNQLFSNISRLYFLKQHVVVKIFLYFLIGVPLGAVLAVMVVKQFNEKNLALSLICLLIVYTLFKPKKLPPLKIPIKSFSVIGFLCGFLGIFVGATGPFLAPFFLRDDLNKKQIVATKAAVQFLVHLVKIPSFIYLAFDYLKYANVILIMFVAAIVGTKLGVILLGKINETVFRWLYKTALFVALLRLLYQLIFA